MRIQRLKTIFETNRSKEKSEAKKGGKQTKKRKLNFAFVLKSPEKQYAAYHVRCMFHSLFVSIEHGILEERKSRIGLGLSCQF